MKTNGGDMNPITAGSRVRIIAVNHHNFNVDIGTTATVVRLVADGTMAWCRPDKLFPKKTRKGIEMVPAHWEILRHVSDLEIARSSSRALPGDCSREGMVCGG